MRNTVKAFIRKDYKKSDGTFPVYIRVYVNKRKKDISLNIAIPYNQWDEKNQRAKSLYSEADEVNLLIDNSLQRARDIFLKSQLKHELLSIEDFEQQFKHEKSSCFYSLCEEIINQNSITKRVSAGTLSGYQKDISKLKKFRTHLSFNEITPGFLLAYESYMRIDLKNKQNTIHRSLKFIRAIVNVARKQGLTDIYAFSKYELRTEKTNRAFLLKSEIEKLIEAFNNGKFRGELRKVYVPFLFCCYTGLRYQDIKNLKHKHISEGTIRIVMHKTKDIVTIPLLDAAKNLIINDEPNEKVFNVPCNQTVNRHLKEIMQIAKIDKKITFHSSRHTFATLALNYGMEINTVQKLLGHRDIKHTQIYAKLLDHKLKTDMAQLNNALVF